MTDALASLALAAAAPAPPLRLEPADLGFEAERVAGGVWITLVAGEVSIGAVITRESARVMANRLDAAAGGAFHRR